MAQKLDGLEAIHPDHYNTGNGASDFRARALHELEPKCVRCGYNDDVRMLDVDHINGRRMGHDISNLQWLCVWCHALKTRKVDSTAK